MADRLRVLVLDDNDDRHAAFKRWLAGHDVVHAHTAAEAFAALGGPRFDVVYLDHDLNDCGYVSRSSGPYGGRELTGQDVAEFIARMRSDALPERVFVHSWNWDGARRMAATLTDAGVWARVQPFEVRFVALPGIPAVERPSVEAPR